MATKKNIRKGSVKTFEDNDLGLPVDRPTKVLAYDDDTVIVEWETEVVVLGEEEPRGIMRTASVSRKTWES